MCNSPKHRIYWWKFGNSSSLLLPLTLYNMTEKQEGNTNYRQRLSAATWNAICCSTWDLDLCLFRQSLKASFLPPFWDYTSSGMAFAFSVNFWLSLNFCVFLSKVTNTKQVETFCFNDKVGCNVYVREECGMCSYHKCYRSYLVVRASSRVSENCLSKREIDYNFHVCLPKSVTDNLDNCYQ